jgi:hypothetical protein
VASGAGNPVPTLSPVALRVPVASTLCLTEFQLACSGSCHRKLDRAAALFAKWLEAGQPAALAELRASEYCRRDAN